MKILIISSILSLSTFAGSHCYNNVYSSIVKLAEVEQKLAILDKVEGELNDEYRRTGNYSSKVAYIQGNRNGIYAHAKGVAERTCKALGSF